MKSLLIGISASLIAILIYELYKLILRRVNKYKLKSILGLENELNYLLAPIYPDKEGEKRIKYRNAYSFGHILELAYRIGKEPQIIPHDGLSEFSDTSDIIAVGGPKSNTYVKRIIKDYEIDFKITYKDEINEFEQPIGPKVYTGFKIGEEIFPASEQKEPAIIIKLTEKEIGEKRTIFLLFGYSAQGTASAAYYSNKEYKRLYKAFKKNKFYILINVSRRESYKVYKNKYIDLTKHLK
jgi:hypothetical protein